MIDVYRSYMDTAAFTLRQAGKDDVDAWIGLFEAVAAEGRWIGTEVPIDREQMARGFVERFFEGEEPAAMFVAEAGCGLIGHLGVHLQHGIAELGMMVAADWRGRGVGSALLGSAVEWAREAGAHKMALQVWPHNAGARRLYERLGFVTEGRLRRHWRRRNGELWDSIVMGLVLDTTTAGSPFPG